MLFSGFGITNILVAAALGFILIYILKRHFKNRQLVEIIDKIPGPVPYPIVGNALQIVAKGPEVIKRIGGRFKLYGPIFRIWFGPKPMVSVSKAELAEVILSSSKHLEKSIFYTHLQEWLGEGLLLAKGERWHKHRKLITPTFHFKILEVFQDIFTAKSQFLVERLEKLSDSGEVFDLYPFVSSATLDIICETALGINIKAQVDTQSEYVKSIYRITEVVSYRNRRIWLHPELIFKFSSYGKLFDKCLNILQDFTKNIINERRIFRKENHFSSSEFFNEEKNDDIGFKRKVALLDLLLEADINEKAICEEVDTFTFEGHDTTSAAISFTLFLLGCHQEIQDEVYDELSGIYQDDRPIKLADLGDMKLLDRVVKEALRLYPPVPIIGRTLDEDVVIGGYKVPSGLDLGIFIYFMHRDPEHFPDPERFDPDRFLPENTKGRHPYAYVPFSAGSRNCIGQKFAMYEVKIVLASLLRRYKVTSMDRREDLKVSFEVVLRSEDGFKFKIEKRK